MELCGKERESEECPACKEPEIFPAPVSYTHLDVYKRQVIRRTNSANDYGKGSTNGVCKEMIDKKQILPHSKIDSFVYATKPSDMYNEWGNFGDPDNKQREIFESVYNVYKKICNEIKDYTEQLGELENKLKQLNICLLYTSRVRILRAR